MKRKLWTGLIVLFGIAAAFAMILLTTGAAIAAWIYMVWTMRKQGTKIFHDRMAPELVQKRYKMLKTSLVVGAVAFAMGVAGIIVHNALYGMTELEEPVSFIIALVALWLFILATGIGVFIYIRGRQKPA